jgi:hypothetical protein
VTYNLFQLIPTSSSNTNSDSIPVYVSGFLVVVSIERPERSHSREGGNPARKLLEAKSRKVDSHLRGNDSEGRFSRKRRRARQWLTLISRAKLPSCFGVNRTVVLAFWYFARLPTDDWTPLTRMEVEAVTLKS